MKLSAWSICISLAVMATICWAAVPQDEIKMLPGLKKQPFFKQYSGYLQASGTKKLHYWFVESQSSSPETDPLVLWMNGGPGCSSVLGLLTENGPFRVLPDGETVVYNPFSWNMVANVLFLEAPAGVGFSYSDDKNYTTSDDLVAKDNFMALKDFFSKYPEYKGNDFYITGESYGGIYVPTLSALVVEDPSIKFKGAGIGNGISDYGLNDNSLLYFAYYHGLIGDTLWSEMIKGCCSGNMTGRCMFTKNQEMPQCGMALSEAQRIIEESGLNVYNLYGECVSGPQTRYDPQLDKVVTSKFGWLLAGVPSNKKQNQQLQSLPLEKLELTPPCINATNIIVYLSSSEVRDALHIPSSVPKWTPCSSQVGANYKRNYDTMAPQYHKLLQAKIRILVYNGDVDMACNFLGDEWFVNSLGIKEVIARKEWFYEAADGTKQVAGFVRQFEGITFVTVRGAGHMVPTDRPAPALILFKHLIQNTPF